MIFPIYGVGKIILNVKKNYTLLGALLSSLFASIFISGQVALFFWLPIIYTMVLAKYEFDNNIVGEWI